MNVQCSPRDSITKGGVCEVATGPCIVHPLSGAVGLSDSLDLDFRVEAATTLAPNHSGHCPNPTPRCNATLRALE